jgi:pyruvate dehydrogenase E2 component (dihydrolipoamide acetyltransferase)
MAVEIILPRVDMDMEAGKITRWFIAEGQSVAKGQPLFEIETDKAAMEIEAPADGVLRGVTGRAGDTFPVGAVVGWIYASAEVFVAAAACEPQVAEASSAGGPRATPAARRIARERGRDISLIEGSGPHGRVQARDVEVAAAPALASPVALDLLNREWLATGVGAPIVFVHGFGADLNSWRPLLGHLAAGRGALALDLPGHGGSALTGAPTLEAMVAELEAALGREGVQSAHFVAHSLGGAIVAHLAARRPALARSLTLLAPAGLGPEVNGAFLQGFLAAQSEASLAPWMRVLATDEAALGSAMVKATLRQRRDLGVGASQARVAAVLFPDGVQAFDARPALAKYRGPTKVVFGLDDRIFPARHARGLPGRIGVHFFANIGHMPHFEARAEVAEMIQDNIAAGESRWERRP